MQEQKKTYTQPTVVEYGKVEKKTLGLSGVVWEAFGSRQSTDDNPIPPYEQH